MGGEPLDSGLSTLLQDKRILISVGSGGVGKTTMAASLGLLAASWGRRTLVMTIDPARRLATSLGLRSLDHEQREVPAEKLAPHGLHPRRMYAMMLDPKQTFDDMVHRYAPDAETAGQLIESKMYQQISSRLAGSQEYAAMEKLHEIRQADDYDLLILDTPPAANALDFLDAPQKMVEAVESPAINLFVRTYRKAGKLSLNLLGFGAAYVIRRLARFTGGGFLDEIAAFLNDLSGLLGGMHDRAAQVMELLAREEVAFILVSSPDPRAIDEAIGFHERLIASEMTPAAFVINRVHPSRPVELGEEEVVAALAEAGVGPSAALARVMLTSHRRFEALAGADAAQIARLRAHCGEGVPYVEVPLFDDDVHDIGGLMQLAAYLR
jgi:anion-transporting  ArsA/GET3 family ATPase